MRLTSTSLGYTYAGTVILSRRELAYQITPIRTKHKTRWTASKHHI